MLCAVERQGDVLQLEEIKAKGITFEVLRNNESRIDVTGKLDRKGGVNTVLFLADKLAYAVGDLVVSADAGDIDLLGDKAKMSEADVLTVNRKLSVVIIDAEKLNAADIGVVKSGALKRAGVAIHRAAALHKLGLLVSRAKGVVICAKLIHIRNGDRTAVRIYIAAEICVATDDIDLRSVVNVVVENRTRGHSFVHKRPAVDGNSILVKIKSREMLRRENVAAGRQSARKVYRVVRIAVAPAGGNDKLGIRAVAELSDKYLRRAVGGKPGIKEVAADKHVINSSLSDKLHKAHKGGAQFSPALCALLCGHTYKGSVKMYISAV